MPGRLGTRAHTFECELRLNETGEYIIPVTLMLSFDRLDYEEINREAVLTINETDGEYEITELVYSPINNWTYSPKCVTLNT